MAAIDAAQLEELNDDLIYFARAGEMAEMLEALDAGAEINATGSGGNTALHMACANGHVACVKELLTRGADALAKNEASNTPAHYAAQQKQTECLKALATTNVDMLAKNEFGRSVLTDAIGSNDVGVATVALEHSSATEEKIIDGLGGETEKSNDREITHSLQLGPGPELISIRELPMTSSEEEETTLGDGGALADRTGLGVWASSLVLARWLTSESGFFKDKRVLELGAGCGVAGIALAASQEAVTVVLADAHPETLANLRHNSSENKRRTTVADFDWSAPASAVYSDNFDVVVGADLVYTDEGVEPLLSALTKLLAGKQEFWYVSTASERAGNEAFVTRLNGHDHEVVDAPAEFYGDPLASQDEAAKLLYFSDLDNFKFKLHRFRRSSSGAVLPAAFSSLNVGEAAEKTAP